ncbi:unnamed protein product [Paramecium primaurelia]|uniref:4Fe-4S ferredoxin-type domain-containing protein n=1 Tax=Paramecium primaurelia TaxID=5886 RepID=A0A8S1M0K2_PARPR|nr:unnamed protein product [Paramecium primaurelia]
MDSVINKNCYPIEGDILVVGQEQCDDGNQIQNDGCFLSQYQYPISCEQGFQGLCQKCISGFFMINNICQENNFDGLVIGIEQCDDQNLIGLDGCFQNRFDCPQFCLSCVFGNCLECDQTSGQGQVDYLNNRCLSICGDGIKSMDEQCDDGNELPYDGCYGCLYECSRECIKCVDGLCYECLSPDWILKNNTCECETCQNLCQNECLSCIKGVCYECQSPEWILDSNNICVYVCGEQCSKNICGDGILNIQIEECDDGNDQIRDGCYNCLLEKGFLCYYDENMVSQGCSRCQDFNCLKCDLVNQSQICSDCLPGYFIDEFKQCQQCDLMCVECSQNYKNCTTVNPQYTKNQQNQQKKCNLNQGLLNDLDFYECVLQCGNGVLDLHEQCDDGNRDVQDGCNEFCQLDEGYLFDHLTHSLQKEPSIQVEKKQSNNNQFSLLINQYQESLNLSTLTVSIEGFSILDYNYSVIENNNQLDLNFTYKKTIEPVNLIHISISYKEYYKKRQLEENINKEIIIVPQRQVYVTEEQKIQGEAMAQTYQTVFQAQIYLVPLAITFGGFQFFLAILDIMSWMNNFYFLNVNYPENVRIIFQQAEWSNIINIPSINLFNKPTDDYYFQAPIKFVEKEIDPLLFNNIQTPIIFAFQVVITYFLSVMIIKIFELICKKKSKKIKNQASIFQLGKDVKHEESTKTQQLVVIPNLYKDLQIPKSLQSFFKNCVSIKSNLIANLIRSFAISYLDITLAVILQITNQQTAHELIVKINIIAAYGFLILVLYLLNISYQISNAHHIKLNNKLFFQRYSCFYEDMKTESQTAMAYSFLNLIRKTIFIFSTVILYAYPIFQTLICFLSCLLNILLLLSSNPFKTKKQYILNLVPDFCITLILGSTIIFAFQDRFKILKDESIYQIGWVVGISIYLSIGLQLFFLIYEIMLSFWQKLKSLIAYLKNKCTKK